MMLRSLSTLITGLVLSLHMATVSADVVVVVSAQSEISELQRINVENIFLGRNMRFPEGPQATPLDLEEGSIERDEFYWRLAGRTSAQIKSFWAKLIFTGRGRPPAVVNNHSELIERLVANPYAIGYIDNSQVDERVKIVFKPLPPNQSTNNIEAGIHSLLRAIALQE